MNALIPIGGVAAGAVAVWVLGSVAIRSFARVVSAEFEGVELDAGPMATEVLVGTLLILLFAAAARILLSSRLSRERTWLSASAVLLAGVAGLAGTALLVSRAAPWLAFDAVTTLVASVLLLLVALGSGAFLFRRSVPPAEGGEKHA
ncbi:MAG: hypothetical protein M3406_06145 [Chloroflexota bacterium]|nr:hypothetical protein [Chloroflexota bacterium]